MEFQGLGIVNYVVIFVYLFLIMGVGVYFVKRQKSTDDYFKGGGRIPGWAAGISVYATTLSSIAYMSIPAKTYTTDWTWIVGQYLVIASFPFIFYFYIPFFRKLRLTSIYEYLEIRFNVSIRLFASLSFMLFHIGRTAIITYLTILALTPFIQIDPFWLVLLVSALCVVYTWLGGIEGVIWTDVIQGILLSGGLVLILVMIFLKVDGGAAEVFRATADADKFFPASQFRWSWKEATFPVLAIGFIFANLQQYTASQDVAQRYLVTKSTEETKRTFITTAKIAGLLGPVLFLNGSALWVFYQQNPGSLPENFNTGGILPFFIVTQLPAGIAGLALAAILAAAQSSISSSLNSISTCFNMDVYRRIGKTSASARENLLCARVAVLLGGVLSCAATLYLVKANESELWDAFNSLLGLLGGPMTGLFALGIFVRRANAGSAVCGVVASIVLMMLTKMLGLNFFFYGVVGTLSVVGVGFLAAPLFSGKPAIVLPGKE